MAHSPTLVLRSDSLTWRVVDDEIVILDLRDGVYYSLNSSAALLWQELSDQGGQPTSALITMLADRYGIETGVARSDTLAFIDQMVQAGLVEWEGPQDQVDGSTAQ